MNNFKAIRYGMLSSIIVTLLLCVSFFQKIVEMFLHNPILNSVITIIFCIGIFSTFFNYEKIRLDMKILNIYKSGNFFNEETQTNSLIDYILRFYQKSSNSLVINSNEAERIISIIKRKINDRHQVNKYIVGILVLFGLLGTFWGLTQTVGSISGTMNALSFNEAETQHSFEMLREGIQKPLSGIGIAFSSSILGLFGSLIVSFLDLQQSRAEKFFFNIFEETVISLISNSKIIQTENSYGPAYVMALLEKTAESISSVDFYLRKHEENRLILSKSLQKVSDFSLGISEQLNANSIILGNIIEQNQTLNDNLVKFSLEVSKISPAQNFSTDVRAIRGLIERLLEEITEVNPKNINSLKEEIRMVVKILSSLSDVEEEENKQNKNYKTV